MRGPRRFWLHDSGKISLTPPSENKLEWLELAQVCEIEKLKAEIKHWQDEEVEKASCCVHNEQENVKLQKKVEILTEALKFYANKDSWEWSDEFHGHEYFMRIVTEDDETYAAGHHGGKRARQALKDAESVK